MMKKILPVLLPFFLFLLPAGAQSISFRVSDGVNNASLQRKMEMNLSSLLTETDAACRERRGLDLSEVVITPDAAASLVELWQYKPFVFAEPPLAVSRALRTYNGGWQVRDIPIEVQGVPKSDAYRELYVDMDADGTITLVNMAIEANQYRKVMLEGTDLADTLRRQLILDYVERFRAAYDTKDLPFMKRIFSDDALIITGKVVPRKGKSHTQMKEEVHYRKENKTDYLRGLERVFASNEYIRVAFDDVKVTQHPTKDGFYGVTVKQRYKSSTYEDEGYVFMLWDFRDEKNPQIDVRTWQPYWLDNEKTKVLEDNQIITINSFKL